MRGKLSKGINSFEECEALCRTIAFMRKYDCVLPLSFLKIYVREKLRAGGIWPFFVFMIAAAMDDIELSVLAFKVSERSESIHKVYMIQLGHELALPGVTDEKMARALLALSLDQGGDSSWPVELWQHFPADYLWAATTAWTRKWAEAAAVAAFNAAKAKVSEARVGRAEKRQRLGTAGHCNPSHCRIHYPNISIDMTKEYEIAIKAVKNRAAP